MEISGVPCTVICLIQAHFINQANLITYFLRLRLITYHSNKKTVRKRSRMRIYMIHWVFLSPAPSIRAALWLV